MPLTRRHLLKLAGITSATAALAGAVRAEGGATTTAAALPYGLTTPMHIGQTALKVRDLAAMTAYYRGMLGLVEIRRDAGGVVLGAGGKPLLHLIHKPDAEIESPNTAGLFHVAYLMPSRADLARWLVHAAAIRVPVSGFADHSVSEAIYLTDPEGNGVEVYSDRPRESWQWNGEVVTMGTRELDIDDIVALTDTGRDSYTTAPDGLRIGHMHLKVGAIAAARDFYGAQLGLASTRGERPDAAFLSSGRYHHHVAANIWNSQGAGPRDAATTGLDWFSLVIADDAILAAQKTRLEAAGLTLRAIDGGVEATDPWGTAVRLLRA
jgi:catechol 2,3-dioxygenase